MNYPRIKRGSRKLLRHGISTTLLLFTVGLGTIAPLCGKEDSYFAEVEIERFSPITLYQLPVISNQTEATEIEDEKGLIISKKPGKTKYGNILLVMELDLFPDQLRTWRQEIIDGIFTTRWGVITIKQRETGRVKIQHIFSEAWPSKLTYVYTEGKFLVYFEIVATTIHSKKSRLVSP
jgi:hypothetical protein